MLKKLIKNKNDYSIEFVPVTDEKCLSDLKDYEIFFNTETDKHCVAQNGTLIEINKNNSMLLVEAFSLIAIKECKAIKESYQK